MKIAQRAKQLGRWRSISVIAVASLAVALPVLSQGAQASSTPPTAPTEIAKGGFGNSQNSYSWSMASYNGKILVGTAGQELCVEKATSDYFLPGKGYYKTNPAQGVTCPADKYDLTARAEIWSYDPSTTSTTPNAGWTRVYQSPMLPLDPSWANGETGKTIGRDIGYRGMVVGGDGALYVGAVTADEYIPGLKTGTFGTDAQAGNPPEILRSTDGVHFTPMHMNIPKLQTIFGQYDAMGWRAMLWYGNSLYATATGGLTGDGVLIRIDNPGSADPTFTQVTPNTLDLFEATVFNNQIYIGTGAKDTGYGVYRSAAPDGTAASWTPIVTNGAGRGSHVSSVVSMGVYRGALFVGASGWYSQVLPSSEVIRIQPDDSWDLITGKARMYNGVNKPSLSGKGDGFGNPFTAHFWRMQDYQGGLYVGTNDWSWDLEKYPVYNKLYARQFGFDIWGTCDGVHWQVVTRNAFGDGQYNFGARTMAATSAGLFIGSANQAQGTAVFQMGNALKCTP